MTPKHSQRSICVFCGSRTSSEIRYKEAAARLGWALADRGIRLVYGGSAAGLMGAVAHAALERGGSVIGVMPKFLAQREMANKALTEMYIVESLEERKFAMSDLSDGFIVLPGGFGTLDELFEVLCHAQLGLHAKPCVLLNVENFFQHLIEFLNDATEHGFISTAQRALLTDTRSIPAAIFTASSVKRDLDIGGDLSKRGRKSAAKHRRKV